MINLSIQVFLLFVSAFVGIRLIGVYYLRA